MNSDFLPAYTLIAMLLVVLAWEMLWPRRPEQSGMGHRWANNLALTIIGQMTARAGQAAVLLFAAWYAQRHELGLLVNPQTPWVLAFVVNMLALEAVGYGMHRAFHKVPMLWRIHAVHHTDTEIDFSSTYRHHPFEILIMQAAALPVVILLAPPVSALLAYQLIRIAINVTAHGNIYLPEALNRALQYFIVTPDFHRLHHSSDRRFTDSNYGTVLPWFDYALGTASHKPFAEHPTMQLGLEYARKPADSRIDRLLLLPFRFKPSAATNPPPDAGQNQPS